MRNIRLGTCSKETEQELLEYAFGPRIGISLGASLIRSMVDHVRAGDASWEEAMSRTALALAQALDRMQALATRTISLDPTPTIVVTRVE